MSDMWVTRLLAGSSKTALSFSTCLKESRQDRSQIPWIPIRALLKRALNLSLYPFSIGLKRTTLVQEVFICLVLESYLFQLHVQEVRDQAATGWELVLLRKLGRKHGGSFWESRRTFGSLRKCFKYRGLNDWAAVAELRIRYCNPESISFTIYPEYGNVIYIP